MLVRFHLGSGINGNVPAIFPTNVFIDVRFHLGSGINGNIPSIDTSDTPTKITSAFI